MCITRTYNIWNTRDGESLSAKAYVQDKTSNKKLVWISQFHLSAADYNILISVMVSGANGFLVDDMPPCQTQHSDQ